MVDEWAHLTGVGPGKRLQNSSHCYYGQAFAPAVSLLFSLNLGSPVSIYNPIRKMDSSSPCSILIIFRGSCSSLLKKDNASKLAIHQRRIDTHQPFLARHA